MPTKYFKKETLKNPFFFNSDAVQFENNGGDDGLIALDTETQSELIAALTEAATKRQKGVVIISKEIYEELKKKVPEVSFQQRSQIQANQIRVSQQPNPFGKPKTSLAVAEPVVEGRTPITSPPPPNLANFKARARRASELTSKPA